LGIKFFEKLFDEKEFYFTERRVEVERRV